MTRMNGDLLFNQTIGMNNSQIRLQVRNSRCDSNKHRLRKVMERNVLAAGNINLLCNLRVIYHMFANDVVLSYLLNKNMGLDIVYYEVQ